MSKKSIENTDVRGRRVLMRVDFNVPQDDDGRITDDRRVEAALPSIRSVIERGGRLILVSHLGRPAGKGFEEPYTLRPVAARLRELLPGVPVTFVEGDCVGPDSRAAADALADGEVLLLDNLRFHPGEKAGDEQFAESLASMADVYCNDAFGAAHRNDASMYTVPKVMAGKPRVAGLLLLRELAFLSDAIEHPKRPFAAVLGGAKVSDKLGAIRNLLQRVDHVLVGGAMAYTMLKAQGVEVGDGLTEPELLDEARAILDQAAAVAPDRIVLPEDHVCAREMTAGAGTRVVEGRMEAGWKGLDIGPRTREQYAAVIRRAKTIVWNGPMGVFETPPFDAGTRAVAEAMVEATEQGGATSIVGGGDSAAAVEQFGLDGRFSHVSTGGGASLQMLEGRKFDSVELLDEE